MRDDEATPHLSRTRWPVTLLAMASDAFARKGDQLRLRQDSVEPPEPPSRTLITEELVIGPGVAEVSSPQHVAWYLSEIASELARKRHRTRVQHVKRATRELMRDRRPCGHRPVPSALWKPVPESF